MDKITEVGQKMRSAIKAKLIELGSYVDDELPDYIMVMVANHRTKEMMAEDLQLFLNENTEIFVTWLHQVLKKLQEVTVSSIDVPKITKQEAKLKRKMIDSKSTKSKKSSEKSPECPKKLKTEPELSLTDEIPVSANTIAKKKISLKIGEQATVTTTSSQVEDEFDIPSMSEFDNLELAEIENRIEAARKKLAMLDNDDDFINLKADDELFDAEFSEEPSNKPEEKIQEKITTSDDIPTTEKSHTPPHKPVIKTNKDVTKPKSSVLDRLGKRASPIKIPERKINLSTKTENKSIVSSVVCVNKEKDKKIEKKPIRERLGLMSRVIPVTKSSKRLENPPSSTEKQNASLSSVVQMKTRKSIPLNKQANRNLLLKAVAEAQKSVTALATEQKEKEKIKDVSSNKKELFTKRYKQNEMLKTETLKNIIVKVDSKTSNEENKNMESNDINQFTATESVDSESKNELSEEINKVYEETETFLPNQRFIVTLDGIDQTRFSKKKDVNQRNAIKNVEKIQEIGNLDEETVLKDMQMPSTLESANKKEKRNPSPIIFDKKEVESSKPVESRTSKVYPALPLKVKERCKYWPGCRSGENCEYLHPSIPCNSFPVCKFGDKCLYVHPPCKFDLSCSRRGCPYIHSNAQLKTMPIISTSLPILSSTIVADSTKQVCKFYPNCTNIQCLYYHPKPCRFGKFCTNITDCTFCHSETIVPIVPTKDKLKWRPS